jgi:hypothetical protein
MDQTENSGATISRRRQHQELYTVLLLALFILFVRKLPAVAAFLNAVPVLGASLPFFILTIGFLI